jgi:hypothetical protein
MPSVVRLSVVMLKVIMTGVIMVSVVRHSVFILTVVVPSAKKLCIVRLKIVHAECRVFGTVMLHVAYAGRH